MGEEYTHRPSAASTALPVAQVSETETVAETVRGSGRLHFEIGVGIFRWSHSSEVADVISKLDSHSLGRELPVESVTQPVRASGRSHFEIGFAILSQDDASLHSATNAFAAASFLSVVFSPSLGGADVTGDPSQT